MTPPIRPQRPQSEIDAAVKKYLQGEPASTLAKQYKVSRAGLYLWIRKARDQAALDVRRRDIGALGVEREERISKDLQIRQLKEENRQLKEKLFELMLRHKLI